MNSYSFSNAAKRPFLQDWFHAATLREINQNGHRLPNGKNEIDVMGGCMTPWEAIDVVNQLSALAVSHPVVKTSYQSIIRSAVRQIAEESLTDAQRVIDELQAAAREQNSETPWLWHTAQEIKSELNL